MDKILLIVDPQVDFISGSLAVEGAKEKMDALAMGYKDNIVVDTKYIASIDGGDKLANLIKNCGLKWD